MKFQIILKILFFIHSTLVLKGFSIVAIVRFANKTLKDSASYFHYSQTQALGQLHSFLNFKKTSTPFEISAKQEKIANNTNDLEIQ